MSVFYIPEAFVISDLAPTRSELQFIHDWLRENRISCDVLEFGSGVTTWAINLAVQPANYVAVESHPACLAPMGAFLPAVKIVSTSWHDIPRLPYGLVFVDSSSGRPTPGRGLFRHEATAYALQLAKRDAVFILHDINLRRKGYQMSIQTLTDAGLKNVARFRGRTGVEIYRRESDLM